MAKRKTSEPAKLRKALANRIVGHGEEKVADMLANPDNWRVHRKTHQNVLVFVKGAGKKAAAACGDFDVYVPEGMGDGSDGNQ
jgi:hypothetical protein